MKNKLIFYGPNDMAAHPNENEISNVSLLDTTCYGLVMESWIEMSRIWYVWVDLVGHEGINLGNWKNDRTLMA